MVELQNATVYNLNYLRLIISLKTFLFKKYYYPLKLRMFNTLIHYKFIILNISEKLLYHT